MKSKYLRHLATFEKKTIVKDDYGEDNEVFSHLATKYVDVMPVSIDLENENQTSYEVSRFEIKTRFSHLFANQIKTGDRVEIDKKLYLIEQKNDNFDRKKISFTVVNYE